MDLAYFRYQEAGVLMLQGRVRDAAAAAADAVTIGRASGLPAMQIPHFLVRAALCHVHLREIAEALALYDEAIALATGSDQRNFEFHARLLRAHRLLRGRRPRRRARRAARAPRRSAASRATTASCACRPTCCRRCSRSRSPQASRPTTCAR